MSVWKRLTFGILLGLTFCVGYFLPDPQVGAAQTGAGPVVMPQCIYASPTPTPAANTAVQLQCNANGQLITSGSGGGGGNTVIVAPTSAAGAVVVTTPGPCATPACSVVTFPQAGGSSGNTYPMAYPDAVATTASIVTATTTQVVPLVAGQSIYVFYAGVQASGTNTTSTFSYEYGTGSACGTGTTALIPAGLTEPAASPSMSAFYSGSSAVNAASGYVPAAVPLVIPAGNALCLVTAGTTTSTRGIVLYAQH